MCFGYIKGLEQCLALAEYYVLLNVFKTIRTVAAAATFEMTIRHPSEDVEQEVGQRGSESETGGGKRWESSV